jgi:transcription initiation factor TFIIIB Brf1 subunit/transcription initiation factor TFIIB
MNDIEYITNALDEADTIVYSYQCPYLALAHVLGYITSEHVLALPSSFTRVSTEKVLKTSGVNNRYLARVIWLMLEQGHSLSNVSEYIRYASKLGLSMRKAYQLL